MDREGMLELLLAIREKLRAIVAEKLRLLQLKPAPAPSATCAPQMEQTPKAAPPSRALLESNRKVGSPLAAIRVCRIGGLELCLGCK